MLRSCDWIVSLRPWSKITFPRSYFSERNTPCDGRGNVEDIWLNAIEKPRSLGTQNFHEPRQWQLILTGVIKLPVLGESNNTKSMVNLRDFPYDNALFGLVI